MNGYASSDQNNITGSVNIDEKSIKQIMHYLKIEDHDFL